MNNTPLASAHAESDAKIFGITLASYYRPGWVALTSLALLFTMLLMVAIAYLFLKGVGIWGINIPVAWGFAIINFVWWIGIGHAGTLISAILLLLNQKWRTSINRTAEAMTLFAVGCAAIYPILHLGRPYLFYWLVPYPNSMGIWPQYRSPLMFDVFAISTYGSVSLMFWYLGLIPDFASLRDRAAKPWLRRTFGLLAFGWVGSTKQWSRYQKCYVLLAGIATPLVVSVHSIVSFDFSLAIVPGWHKTIFPPYFVAGAIFSGFAMVLNILIPVRYFYSLQNFITGDHLDKMAKVMLVSGLVVAYGYLMEIFMGVYSAEPAELDLLAARFTGAYAGVFWSLIICNILLPQLLWLKTFRVKPVLLFLIALSVNIGMWLERFVIIVTSLYREYMPSKWHIYIPTFWDWATLFGSIGLFFFLLLLFLRFLPVISAWEIKEIQAEGEVHGP